MNSLAHLLVTGIFLGFLAVLATGLLLGAANPSLRRARAAQRRQRERVRREYWGYE